MLEMSGGAEWEEGKVSQRSGAMVQAGSRHPAYYTQARVEVADLVPTRCHRVLAIGCGAGRLGELLRQRGHHVSGVELIAAAAAEAKTRLDSVHILDIETQPLPFVPGLFDALVFADVLEHLL